MDIDPTTLAVKDEMEEPVVGHHVPADIETLARWDGVPSEQIKHQIDKPFGGVAFRAEKQCRVADGLAKTEAPWFGPLLQLSFEVCGKPGRVGTASLLRLRRELDHVDQEEDA